MGGESLGRLLGRPTPAKPLGEESRRPVSTPRTAGVGLVMPGREDEDPKLSFQTEVPDPGDAPDDPPLTTRQRYAIPPTH